MVWSGWRTTINDRLPEVSTVLPFDSHQWTSLLKTVDRLALLPLPSTIGCPDCADGGSESVTVHFPNDTVGVTFDHGASVASIQPLIQQMRDLASRAPRPAD